MKRKFPKFVLFLTTTICFGILCILFLVLYSSQINTNLNNNSNINNQKGIAPTPVVTSSKELPSNINNEETDSTTKNSNQKKYELLILDTTNTLSLFTLNGEKLTIYIDAPSLSEILWNENKDKVAFLIKEKDVQNLYYYDINTKVIQKATNYTITGVVSYIWLDNNRIFFTQGPENDHWIHLYDTNANNILKITKIQQGEFVNKNPDSSYLIFSDEENFYIINNKGEVIRPIQNKFMFDNEEHIILDVFYLTNNFLILQTGSSSGKYFFINDNLNTFFEKVDNVNLSIVGACTNVNSQEFYLTTNDNDIIKSTIVNTEEIGWKILKIKTIGKFDISKNELLLFKCNKDMFLAHGPNTLQIFKNSNLINIDFITPKQIISIDI